MWQKVKEDWKLEPQKVRKFFKTPSKLPVCLSVIPLSKITACMSIKNNQKVEQLFPIIQNQNYSIAEYKNQISN